MARVGEFTYDATGQVGNGDYPNYYPTYYSYDYGAYGGAYGPYTPAYDPNSGTNF